MSAVLYPNGLQQRIARLDRRLYALLIGGVIGIIGGGVGLLIAIAGPIIAAGAIIGAGAALYILTNLTGALYGVVLVMALLPFGTFPFRIGFTPTLIDAAMGAFALVYALQWMTRRRRAFRVTPVHALIALYMGWLILSFVLGLRYASPTSAILRQFAETLLSIGMTFILVDLLREPAALRRLFTLFLIAAGLQAVIAVALWALPDELTERTLIRLARLGYPDGGVIRYIEDNPDLSERAIGTWVDPNALGGWMAIAAAFATPQLFGRFPLIRSLWIRWSIFGILAIALILTFSRASMLGLAISVAFVGLIRGHRRLFVLVAMGAVALLILPQTREYIERFAQAFAGEDLATQMRVGEYGDSLELIAQYPITGVGFTGTPQIDLYTDVASMYLIMANQIGLVGVGIFASIMLGVFAYAWRARAGLKYLTELNGVFIGAHAALIAVLLNAIADLYYFRLDFQASITLLWFVVALALTSSHLLHRALKQVGEDEKRAAVSHKA